MPVIGIFNALEITDRYAESFWQKLDRADLDSCWEWPMYRSEAGYGRLGARGVDMYAHRLAYYLTHGDIPKGMFVCHRCNNPPCCNPGHHFLGAGADNADDMAKKGRAPQRGERSRHAKITEAQVIEIRIRRASGELVDDLAREFGMHPQNLRAICSGRFWSHVGGPLTTRKIGPLSKKWTLITQDNEPEVDPYEMSA